MKKEKGSGLKEEAVKKGMQAGLLLFAAGLAATNPLLAVFGVGAVFAGES